MLAWQLRQCYITSCRYVHVALCLSLMCCPSVRLLLDFAHSPVICLLDLAHAAVCMTLCVQVVWRASVTVTAMSQSVSVTMRQEFVIVIVIRLSTCSSVYDTVCTGCVTCECNGHGDESVGVCDNETGVCYCTHNTHGHHCQFCESGYYGDPRSVEFMFVCLLHYTDMSRCTSDRCFPWLHFVCCYAYEVQCHLRHFVNWWLTCMLHVLRQSVSVWCCFCNIIKPWYTLCLIDRLVAMTTKQTTTLM